MTEAPAVLDRVRALVEPAMRTAVDTLDPNLATPATYHLGWTNERGEATPGSAGKGVRAALAVLGAEAVRAPAQDCISGAVAIELIHNFSLIHDDIMDGDRMRRHRRTVWDVFGIGDAIIVGDALHVLAFQVLASDLENQRSVRALERLTHATSAMIAGQAQDVALDRAPTATLAQCLAMEANKTGALLAQSIAIGAELGGGDADQTTALEQYGMAIGRAFQAIDDVLGIWGDPAVTGKPAGNDLRERKKSVPVAIALDQGGELRDTVMAAYAAEPDDDQIAALSAALDNAGVRSKVEAVAQSELQTAVDALETADLAATACDELRELATFVVTRNT